MRDRQFTSFSDIKYVRPDVDAYKAGIREFIDKFQRAESYEKARALYLERDAAESAFDTAYQIAYIRNTIETTDEFYAREIDFLDEQRAKLSILEKGVAIVLVKSPYAKDFEMEFGADIIKKAEAEIRLSDESVVDDKIAEMKLCQEYSRAAASCKTNFMGEECNFYGLLRFMQDPDRDIRKAAFREWTRLYEGISGKLNDIFIKLVALRRGMAEKLGFKNYSEMAYLMNEHYYYGAEEIALFRDEVVTHLVPVADKLYREQAKKIGVDRIHYYDEEIKFSDGNAKPSGGEDELIAAAAKMYGEMSPETGEFFSFMTGHGLFDLTTRPGKHLGGYCTFLSDFGAPFIFSNFNGTSADVDVLTHEAGHAFQAYTASRAHPLSTQVWSTNEISEIHSMTMELFAYRHMAGFFGESAEKYCRGHFEATIETVPYLCLVDHFQHAVYEEENLTGEKLAKIWNGLEKVYLPWRSYDGEKFLEDGGFWMQKQHIFLYPFYYIDYALAQMGAFELFNRAADSRKTAWDDYLRLCKAGGSMPYFELLKYAHLSNPFDSATVERVTEGVKERLNGKLS
ncbi:MAG: M3 family oligoendopeptidase [Clostridia bacterium]|nr:M3 family oligoendopeptidase [Clostridia bacterium]